METAFATTLPFRVHRWRSSGVEDSISAPPTFSEYVSAKTVSGRHTRVLFRFVNTGTKVELAELLLILIAVIQTEAERRRREPGVKQSMEIRLRSLRARPKAERVFAEYENFLNLSDPTRPDPTGTLFSVLYLLNQATDWKMVFAI